MLRPVAEPPNRTLLPRVLRLLVPPQSGKGELTPLTRPNGGEGTPMGPLGEVPVVQVNLARNAVAAPAGARAASTLVWGGAVVPGGVAKLVPPVIPFTTGKKVGVTLGAIVAETLGVA